MDAVYDTLRIDLPKAEEIASRFFNVKGKASPLPGELDFNFFLRSGNSRYILKISRPDADAAYLDFQEKILIHVNQAGSGVAAPVMIPGKDGQTVCTYTDEEGNNRRVRLLSWIEGRTWPRVNPHSDSLLQSLGAEAGKVTRLLSDFD